MSTPVLATPKLSKKERKALLAKNKSFEKSLKNVITTPKNILSPLPKSLFSTPTSIKVKSKEAAEVEFSKEELRPVRPYLAIGVNAVSRALEKKLELTHVLVAGDAEKAMVQHLITLATRVTKVTVAPDLRNIALQTIGVSTCALAFKKPEEPVPELYNKVVDKIMQLVTASPESTQVDPPPRIETPPLESPIVDMEEEEVKKWQNKQVRNWHLPRTDPNKKAFIPSGEVERTRADKVDFIALDVDDDIPDSKSSVYLPLRMKRVKPNSGKVEKKKKKKKLAQK